MKFALFVPLTFSAVVPLAAQAQVPAQAEPVAAATAVGTRLEVVAEGVTRRVPDLATISAGVVTQAPTAAAALSANAQQMTRVLAGLRRAGIAERDVQTDSVGLEPQYRFAENQPPVITGYQARNSVSVRFRDIARAGAILDALVQEGANQINGPNLSLSQPDAAMDEARGDAIAKARARADIYARTLNMRVVRIVSVSEAGSGMQPLPIARASIITTASTPISPGEQQVGVTVNVVFELR